MDGSPGPQHPHLDSNQLVSWTSDTLTPYLAFEMTDPYLTISAIKLHVLNHPAEAISLPNFHLYQTSDPSVTDPNTPGIVSVNFDLINNDELSQDDFIVRRIILRPRTPFSSPGVLIRWDFSDLFNVLWFAMSEVKLCGDTQPTFTPSEILVEFLSPATDELVPILPSAKVLMGDPLTLTCTVSLEGSFEWRWRRGIVKLSTTNKTTILSADGTRTSKLFISDLTFEDAGIYACEATFANVFAYETRRHNIQFLGKFR